MFQLRNSLHLEHRSDCYCTACSPGLPNLKVENTHKQTLKQDRKLWFQSRVVSSRPGSNEFAESRDLQIVSKLSSPSLRLASKVSKLLPSLNTVYPLLVLGIYAGCPKTTA
ncbi:hypothetical protein AVEN_229215-1 [Araneus ventricosus]|uniref:Uncharacterized protein n=1 Tax=Araneus ventricosus TaxID=182803 RepID=A0A4Y2S8B6_ARAVE|nr:hypothetical protein AVEN_229215-1 [Araneus ventricosus]